MEKHTCFICNKIVTAHNSYIGSHVKRMHGLSYKEYVCKYYNEIGFLKIESCGFCPNDAEPNYEINHAEFSYSKNYNLGYLCNTQTCINNISLEILGCKYESKKYEHIGSNSKYIQKKYKLKDLNDANKLKHLTLESVIKKNKKLSNEEAIKKYNELKEENNLLPKTTSLKDYILRYGESEGILKYKERNIKIGKTSTNKWYIDKFGIELGNKKWNEYREKLKKSTLGTNKSKTAQNNIEKHLNDLNVKFEAEYQYISSLTNKVRFIDYYLLDYNLCIEFYGDYWHCNPKIYKSDYLHKTKKISAEEIWENDKNRIKDIIKVLKSSVLIIWESTKFNAEYLFNLLESIKNKTVIIEI